MSNVVLTSSSLDKIRKITSIKFGVDLSQKQILELIEAQPEELRKALQAEQLDIMALDQLVENISEEITGINYPTEHSTPYYKEYFKKKLKENKDQYFGFSS